MTHSPPSNSDLLCVTDVGSTTTKACLFFRRDDSPGRHWAMLRREAATTVEKPDEDVTVGVRRALRALETAADSAAELGDRSTSREPSAPGDPSASSEPSASRGPLKLLAHDRPALPFFATSSAGGGLAVAVAGLMRAITSQSAERVALGAGALVLDVIAVDDGRTPYRRIKDLEALRPDIVLLAGGFDGEDAISGPVSMAELLNEANLHPKRNPTARLPVLYAGNRHALPYVQAVLEPKYLVRAVENLRPTALRERLGPAREAMHELFMDHVMSHAPGYPRLKEWVDGPLLPTPAAFGKILELASKETRGRILAVDVGGATTDVFTAEDGVVRRTVSANLGMSYSILQVVRTAGLAALRSLLDPDLPEDEILNRIGEKYLNPTRLPRDEADAEIERAVATLAVREAVRAHFRVLSGQSEDRTESELRFVTPLLAESPKGRGQRREEEERAMRQVRPNGYDILIGSGGALSHVPRDTAARILVDALRPPGQIELAVDSAFIFPQLGLLSTSNPEIALELYREIALIPLGRARDHEGVPRSTHPLPATHPAPETERVSVRAEKRLEHGEIRLSRALSIPGEVMVKPGDQVEGATLIARSTRLFLRPFFLRVAAHLRIPPEQLEECLVKKPGDLVLVGECVARRKGKRRSEEYRAPVNGLFEKTLPDGSICLRELPEQARTVVTVHAARELKIASKKLAPLVRCTLGQEVEAGQHLTGDPLPMLTRRTYSPIRGRVVEIDLEEGLIRVEPLQQELEVRAWIPGDVAEVSDRGAVVVSRGTIVTGAWGSGGETSGALVFGAEAGSAGEDTIEYQDHLTRADLEALRTRGARGVIAAGAELGPLLDGPVLDMVWPFTVVILNGFGRHQADDAVAAALRESRGRVVYLDGTTELRVGVRRPRVVIPDRLPRG